jgi:hypothetical protein
MRWLGPDGCLLAARPPPPPPRPGRWHRPASQEAVKPRLPRRCMSVRGLHAVILGALLCSCAHVCTAFEWAVVCDAGSTGTRLYVYHMATGAEAATAARKRPKLTAIEGPKVKPGLSKFGTATSAALAAYIAPLVAKAEELVPGGAGQHARTPFFVRATAGMRLLPEAQQERVYDALYVALQRSPFITSRSHLSTLDGTTEGFFGLLAANQLSGRLGPGLRPLGELIGALDLGGSSTQIAFPRPGTGASGVGGAATERDFYVHSYLGFGAELAREKLQAKYAAAAGQRVDFACFFRGFELEQGGSKLVGIGDGRACREQIRSTVRHVGLR